MKRTRTYRIWRGMKTRCDNPQNDRDRRNYQERGIGYHERWRDFAAFLADMGPCPDGLQIDRIDNDKGYSKENCRWTTVRENTNNRRNSVIVEFDGELMPVTVLAEKAGIDSNVLAYRIRSGWSVRDATTKPVRKWP